MRIFLDSADVKEIKRWLPIIDGVTTNPSILEKDGGDLGEIAKLIFPKVINIEACGNIIDDAKYWSGIASNAVIKVPLINPDGSDNVRTISELSKSGIKVNCTALFNLSQVLIAERAGSNYVSLFIGRMDDEGVDFISVIEDCMRYLEHADLIAGSIRTVGNVLDSIKAGADIVTIPPAILQKMIMQQNSLKTVREFASADERLNAQNK